MNSELSDRRLKWYEGITGYQWLVLVVASLGWVFDVFEGQIFVASMRDAMPQRPRRLEVATADSGGGAPELGRDLFADPRIVVGQ